MSSLVLAETALNEGEMKVKVKKNYGEVGLRVNDVEIDSGVRIWLSTTKLCLLSLSSRRRI